MDKFGKKPVFVVGHLSAICYYKEEKLSEKPEGHGPNKTCSHHHEEIAHCPGQQRIPEKRLQRRAQAFLHPQHQGKAQNHRLHQFPEPNAPEAAEQEIMENKQLNPLKFRAKIFDQMASEDTGYSNYSYWRSTFRTFFKNKAVLLLVALICGMLCKWKMVHGTF